MVPREHWYCEVCGTVLDRILFWTINGRKLMVCLQDFQNLRWASRGGERVIPAAEQEVR